MKNGSSGSVSFDMRETIFAISWRIALLLLPWQTRWIFSEGNLGEFGWEQGTLAIYASWLLLALAIATAPEKRGESSPRFTPLQAWGVMLLVAVTAFTSSVQATLLFWAHLLILFYFFHCLIRAHVSLAQVSAWFVVSIVPHAALGVVQFLNQDVAASTILGIAAQDSAQSGVSVVEHGLYRVLRAYGGMPHPNILGGYLAIGLTLLPTLAVTTESKFARLAVFFTGLLFTIALVFTFSRGAWIAALLGFGFAIVFAYRRSHDTAARQSAILLVIFIAAAAGFGVVTQFDHIAARFQPEHRLEAWSFTQRRTAIQEGFEAWKERSMFGWGPGASKIGILHVRDEDSPQIPPEPPHAVPFVAMLETGILGLLGIFLLCAGLWRSVSMRAIWQIAPFLAATFTVMATDHYLWTLWAGQSLLAVLIYFVIKIAEPSQAPGA